MLSGNGRHRRPRQAPALLVAAGVTGSAIAIPLIGAGGASAADGNAWDKVAKCESGGAWSADTGNGYYGGLQLTQDDWEKYGGLDYASSADQASRSQQIAVAEKLLADKGPGAWPTCGLLSGLSKKSGAAKVDTGVGDSSGTSNSSGKSVTDDLGLSDSSQESSSDPSGSSDVDPGSTDSSGSPAASPTTSSPSPSSPAEKGKPAESDTSSDVAAGGSQSPDASPSITPQPGDTDNSWQIGGTSALVDTGALGGGRHRGGSAVEDPADSHAAASSGRHASRGGSARAVVADSYTVRAGDSLESIADSLDVPGGWDALYAANRGAIGSDPNHISAGQTLNVPTETPQK
ncbi:transglycosylase family protein [Streptomyces sp. NPDC001231]|uniref:transglycosylase family protein n=1 Tax=Streptomyces sp. NPDC001231 TaxID=3364549 RepID=UPI0036B5596E